MRTVRDLMTSTVTTLHPSDSSERAAREMSLSHIRHLPIVDREGRLVGLLSDRDLAAATTPVMIRDLMTRDLMTVAPETPLTEAAFLLLHHRISSLPVCDASQHLLGILTETDFLRLAYTLLGGPPLEDREREDHESTHL